MATEKQLFAGEVAVGTSLGPLVFRPTTVTLFRFSAVTWNPHRVHYDAPYAATEGYPGVLVQSHLHGCWLAQLVMQWAGPRARLRRFGWQNRHYAVPADTLRCSGDVTGTDDQLVECQLEEINQHGETCTSGWAVVELPRRKQEG